MSELRYIVAGQLLTGVLIEAALWLLPTPTATLVMVTLVALLFLVDVLATAYIPRALGLENVWRDSWLTVFVAYSALTITGGLALVVISGVVPYIWPDFKVGPREFVILLGSGVALIATVPMMNASLFLLVSRRQPPVQGAGPTVIQDDAGAASEVPLPPADEGPPVDNGHSNGAVDPRTPVHPAELNESAAG